MPPPRLPGGVEGQRSKPRKWTVGNIYSENFQNGLLVIGLVCLDAKLGHGHRVSNLCSNGFHKNSKRLLMLIFNR
jgi:hypothetical protein